MNFNNFKTIYQTENEFLVNELILELKLTILEKNEHFFFFFWLTKELNSSDFKDNFIKLIIKGLLLYYLKFWENSV